MAITISGSGITSANIADGTIVNADVNASAAIDASKLTGTGKVLQVVSASYGTRAISSTATFADTGLTATITPSATTSKILVMAITAGVSTTGATDDAAGLRLLRGSTTISNIDNMAGYMSDSSAQIAVGSVAINYIDSPNTTSATTYKTQFANGGGAGGAVRINEYYSTEGQSVSTLVLMEIGA